MPISGSVEHQYFPVLLDIIVQRFVEGVARERGGVADDYQFHPGTGDGDVHPAQVIQETDPSLVVGTNQAD